MSIYFSSDVCLQGESGVGGLHILATDEPMIRKRRKVRIGFSEANL